jgi:hypothetical protein
MVLAYLIRDHGMTFEEAYHCVKLRRKIVLLSLLQISPNEGFIKQLREYASKTRQAEKAWQLTPPREKNAPPPEKQKLYSTTVHQKGRQADQDLKWTNIQNEE